ncbi:PAS-domain containing protein [Azospirillum canadense]|uniref:PAS-domain containing protein n=1 Tax=Azospirillum canadense TaxID=403962 RepID=UPI002227130F|nr:PAS-domain containing protein [Azospirillum canadense]MCW2238307.1 signal transduction histidine kinase/CheY-like chemotaxis protein/HPt (histidine-containing phosphotransfer) domain-containing protein [Azospirillum canadense]
MPLHRRPRRWSGLTLVAVLLLLATALHTVKHALDHNSGDMLWSLIGIALAGLVMSLALLREGLSTDRARAEAEAAERRAVEAHRRLTEAIEAIDEGFALFDADDRLVQCNARYREICAPFGPVEPGVRFEDLIRRGVALGHFPESGSGGADRWIAARLDHHRNPGGPLLQPMGDGRWFKIDERRTSDGGYVGLRTDITELKRREEELALKSDLLEATLAAMTQGLVVWSADGHFLACNKRLLAILELPEALMRPGLTLQDWAHHLAERGEFGPGDPDELTAQRLALMEPDANNRSERVRPNGRVLEITAGRMRDRSVLMTYTDITEHRRAEAQLRLAKEEAERASRAKTGFLRTISHEIRTPMNGVLGMLGLLLDGPLGEGQRRYAQTARESAEALLAMLNDLLDISKMEAGKLTLDLTPFTLVDVVESVVELQAARAHAKGIDLACCVPAGLPERLRGDCGRLRQVLLNLVGNAVKFTNRGGATVTASLAERAADGSAPEPDGTVWLRFEVADSGIGIPDGARGDLFTEFAEIHPRLARRDGGAGLGLAISKRLVDMMGGVIGCEPAVEGAAGGGSRFWFTLPLRIESAVEGAAADSGRALAGRRVLLLEPNPLTRRALARQIHSWGAEVHAPQDSADIPADTQSGFDVALVGDAADPALAKLPPRLRAAGARRIVRMAVPQQAPQQAPQQSQDADAVLAKPIRQARLLEALGGPAPRVASSTAPCSAAEPPTAAVDALPGQGRRILLVEDSPTNQMVAALVLRGAGYRVDVAGNGIEAIEAVTAARYDLILMDISMPEMDGLMATQILRGMPPPAGTVPIVAMTADAMDSDRDRCLAAGMNDHVAKPVDRTRLLGTVARWLADGEGPSRENVPAQDAPAPAPDSDALDADVLNQLMRDLNPDILADVIREFVEETMARAERIARTWDDLGVLAREAHTLKSTASTFGARALSAAARALEAACRDNAVGEVESLCRDIPRLTREAVEAYRIRGYLSPSG